MLTPSATAAFSTPILSPHIPLFIECDAFCFLNFSHTVEPSTTAWFQVVITYLNFAMLLRWYFSILSHLFSVVAMVIQMKCPPFQLTSRSAFDILPTPIDVSLNYSLSHPQIQLAFQTWPLALLSAYFGCIRLLRFKTSLCLHCLMLSWSGLSWTRTTTSGPE